MEFLKNESKRPRASLLLAHGAGAPMDTPFMEAFASGLSGRNIHVVRFEFAYMAERRDGGSKRPPPRIEKLIEEYRSTVEGLSGEGPLFIGGKSLGGRVASVISQELHDDGQIAGLLCLGYPFHPPGKPEKLRTAHLLEMTVPALIAQGERDPFGSREDIATYKLPPSITMHWAVDGNHDLKPRKSSGVSAEDNWSAAADTIAIWIADLAGE